jgi:hypothetical protein
MDYVVPDGQICTWCDFEGPQCPDVEECRKLSPGASLDPNSDMQSDTGDAKSDDSAPKVPDSPASSEDGSMASEDNSGNSAPRKRTGLRPKLKED